LYSVSSNTPELDLSNVSAEEYIYLKLKAKIGDTTNNTPAQIKRWHVLYKEVPEATIDPSTFFTFHADTVREGETLKLKTAFRNISRTDFDSLVVHFFTEDADKNIKTLSYAKIPPLKADSSQLSSVEFSSLDLIGENRIWVELNPKDNLWQREQYHFNNKLKLNFFVKKDQTNPLLDVTFDGIRILNGDIVSAKPFINITLKDENKFRALNDTANFRVYLKDPAGQLTAVHFMHQGMEQMKFYPASLPKNSCRIEYRPQLLIDGEYEFRVQARDASNNLSGSNDYVIRFNVINKSMITEVMNFPNPFTTSTRFVFTLTGSEIPSHFKIQILTITGKVVKEIHRDELGPIRIGRNITDYAWDGRDDFGDRLANGVYLYRVITRINGEPIEHLTTNADQYFQKGFGKMYLMR
jgi:hypothetical protein